MSDPVVTLDTSFQDESAELILTGSKNSKSNEYKDIHKLYYKEYILPIISTKDDYNNGAEDQSTEDIWDIFWTKEGNSIALKTWILKYRHYLVPTADLDNFKCKCNVENCKCDFVYIHEQLNNMANNNFREKEEEDDESWEELWREHCQAQYITNYQLFSEIYNSINSLEDTSDVEFVDSIEYESDTNSSKSNNTDNTEHEEWLEMSLLGLPTSFGKKKKSKQLYKSNRNNCNSNIYADNNEDAQIKNQCASLTLLKDIEDVPPEIKKDLTIEKYWKRRYTLFSKFDEGIKLDKESWFSVTPEKIAKHIAKRMSCGIIIDAFCGSGGNCIQFAFTCNKVIAIDIDPKKIEQAKHNAKIYGVDKKIDFIIADFLQISENLFADCTFLSPPWGGPDYIKSKSFDIDENMELIPTTKLIALARKISKNIAIYMPKNSNREQLIKAAGSHNPVNIQRCYLNKKLIALTAYYGDLATKLQENDKCEVQKIT